jgi:L,D-peptidoglycan transpeptidase YkuD (ErfK/YbiS/YcfS/YnhG family)
MEIPHTSITYQTVARDRPASAIRINAAAGDPCRGWLTADGQTIPVALGRGGIRANKREGDGGTPKAPFAPGSVVACRPPPEARTFLPVRAIRPKTPGAKIPKAAITTSRYGRAVAAAIAHARRPPHDFIVEIDHQLPRIAGRGSAVFLHWRARISGDQDASMTKPAMLRLLARLGPETRIVIG